MKRNQRALGPEISEAKLLDYDDQSNDFCNTDPSKLLRNDHNMEASRQDPVSFVQIHDLG
jgi:hypothetical protein